jgi:hypothetical protein
VAGVACLFRDGFVTLRRDDALGHFILIGMKFGVVLIDFRDRSLQGFGTLAAPIPHVKRNNLARGGVHRLPNPLLVGLLLHKAPHFVGFSLELVNPYLG